MADSICGRSSWLQVYNLIIRILLMKLMNRKMVITAVVSCMVIAVSTFTIYNNNRKTVKPRVTSVVDAVYALGIVTPYKEYSLRVGMSTRIEKLYIWEGDRVQAGSPLVQLDGGILLRAPFSGVVATLNRKESEIVSAQESIMTIVDPATMYIRLSLDQESIINVRKKQIAEISFENLRNKNIRGVVSRIYPSGGEFVVAIDVDSFPEGVLPYMTCDVAIVVSEKNNALLLPENAVHNGAVTLIRNGKKLSVNVSTRTHDNGWVEIVQGNVTPDDTVVVMP
ncbi:MAG TPA: HlyD family efflux transporter periplasmic adaptor subunit [Spirochaetota bacterium]|nr:HlyD family efflux transporter periplasmic adaptor subunit [Spirochaetota bacterium]